MGSSKNMTGGLLTSSRAMARRFLCPPESRAVLVWEQDIRPSAVRISVTWPGPPPTPGQLQNLRSSPPPHHPNLKKHFLKPTWPPMSQPGIQSPAPCPPANSRL